MLPCSGVYARVSVLLPVCMCFVCMCSGYACVHECLLPIKRNKSEDMMGHIEPVLQAAVTLQHMFVQG